jgi:phage baseplate assembly protein W
MLNIDFPYSIDSQGKTPTTTWPDHVRDMLLQFLLTCPGERVNRPDFGTPLSRMCFEGNSPEMADIIQFIASAGLQRWLGEVLDVSELAARADDAALLLELSYRVRGDDEVRSEQHRIPFSGGSVT